MLKVNSSWTLFLDRDGVINKRLPGQYVKSPIEFEFLPGVLQALPKLAQLFGHIFIVTNQHGVAKGEMDIDDLDEVHEHMIDQIKKAGGRIDKIYACTESKEMRPNCRKPDPGMALWAKMEFPEIQFYHSVMVGDSADDILFGQKLGMYTVAVSGKDEELEAIETLQADFYVHGLQETLRIFGQIDKRGQIPTRNNNRRPGGPKPGNRPGNYKGGNR
ncbi:MAG: HAD-IIIA family hydrolase [Saprospiraceae bacterium]